MKKVEFKAELSEKAMNVYINSSFVFYKNEDGIYYMSDSYGMEKREIGTLEDVEERLLIYAE